MIGERDVTTSRYTESIDIKSSNILMLISTFKNLYIILSKNCKKEELIYYKFRIVFRKLFDYDTNNEININAIRIRMRVPEKIFANRRRIIFCGLKVFNFQIFPWLVSDFRGRLNTELAWISSNSHKPNTIHVLQS